MGQGGPKLSGAEIFFECLKREKVEYIFGYPGGSTLKIYEKLYDIDFLQHILCRHEQGATHMAEGYAKATGKVGVVLVTSGPGATNTVTGITDAYMDSVPIVVFTGQVPTSLIGNDAFQEADIIGITRPITKHSFLVRNVNELAPSIKKAFYIASTGRPGPVVVDLPKDMINSSTEFVYPDTVDIRGYKPKYTGHQNQIKKAAQHIASAKRPVLYVGGGVIMSNATQELRSFAIEYGLPVTMTLQGLGAFPGTSELSLGMLGMHGTYWANQAINNCDVLVALGARFDDRVTGKIDTFAPDAYKIHVDIDPTAIDKNVLVDLPIVGDVKNVITELRKVMPGKPQVEEWMKKIQGWKKDCPLEYEKGDGKLKTEYVLEKISEITKGEAVIVTDVGQHQMWAAQYYKYMHPRSNLTSGGLGTMGFSLPASIGASFGVKDRPVFSISGDGGFQMNIQELITIKAYNLPIKIIIINNSFLGMVRQWQELFHAEKYSFTNLSKSNPDFVKIGQAIGIESYCTENPDDVDDLLKKALKTNDRPTLIEFKVVKEDMVFPMVPSGSSISDMLLKRLNPQRMV
ncbi:MAG: biosynthetic-type acetolactate synthase large subunit [Calditrichaceae bacterium]|nr:biosynthetic-type acetolactate synthase large subunit [Calditrichaceae bacterium]MBN2710558.1 biosynthetic-type acetolactate synthase large subunit [Calditrichaceae bacterium]RQV96529.1 MAG: biosynthetic-type acetolactate synthase large subunit [Calditrichota bacterium]